MKTLSDIQKLQILVGIFVLAFAFLIANMYSLQIRKGKFYEAKAPIKTCFNTTSDPDSLINCLNQKHNLE